MCSEDGKAQNGQDARMRWRHVHVRKLVNLAKILLEESYADGVPHLTSHLLHCRRTRCRLCGIADIESPRSAVILNMKPYIDVNL